MTYFQARDLYHNLTQEQKHFVEHKTINTTFTIRQWISFLKDVAEYDSRVDSVRKRFTTQMIISGVCTFFCAFAIFAVSSASDDGAPPWLIAIAIGLPLWLIYAIIQYRRLSKRSLSNYLRKFFLPLLENLRPKAGDDAKLVAALDFRDPFKHITPEELSRSRGRKENLKIYRPKMIVAGVPLLDQSYVELILMDQITRISYRNARGKLKSKTKTLHRLWIRLTQSKALYARTPEALPPNIQLEEQPNHLVFKLKHKAKEDTLAILKPDAFLQQMGLLYSLVIPVAGAAAYASQAGPGPYVGQNMAQALFWSNDYFSHYDHDSLRSSHRHPTLDDDSRNIFDS